MEESMVESAVEPSVGAMDSKADTTTESSKGLSTKLSAGFNKLQDHRATGRISVALESKIQDNDHLGIPVPLNHIVSLLI